MNREIKISALQRLTCSVDDPALLDAYYGGGTDAGSSSVYDIYSGDNTYFGSGDLSAVTATDNLGGQSSLAQGSNTFQGIANAITSVFGSISRTVNPPRPGTTINPATGRPYPVGTQIAGSGLFSNPLLLLLLIFGGFWALKKS